MEEFAVPIVRVEAVQLPAVTILGIEMHGQAKLPAIEQDGVVIDRGEGRKPKLRSFLPDGRRVSPWVMLPSASSRAKPTVE